MVKADMGSANASGGRQQAAARVDASHGKLLETAPDDSRGVRVVTEARK